MQLNLYKIKNLLKKTSFRTFSRQSCALFCRNFQICYLRFNHGNVRICELAHLRNLRICENCDAGRGKSPRICGLEKSCLPASANNKCRLIILLPMKKALALLYYHLFYTRRLLFIRSGYFNHPSKTVRKNP